MRRLGIEVVDTFSYLGDILTVDGHAELLIQL